MATDRRVVVAVLQHHQAGNFAQAEELYQQVLHTAPRNAVAIHFLGMLAHKRGQHDLVLDVSSPIAGAEPRRGRVSFQPGSGLSNPGQLDQAVVLAPAKWPVSGLTALRFTTTWGSPFEGKAGLPRPPPASRRPCVCGPALPRHAATWRSAWEELGRWDEALTAYREAIQRGPATPTSTSTWDWLSARWGFWTRRRRLPPGAVSAARRSGSDQQPGNRPGRAGAARRGRRQLSPGAGSPARQPGRLNNLAVWCSRSKDG